MHTHARTHTLCRCTYDVGPAQRRHRQRPWFHPSSWCANASPRTHLTDLVDKNESRKSDLDQEPVNLKPETRNSKPETLTLNPVNPNPKLHSSIRAFGYIRFRVQDQAMMTQSSLPPSLPPSLNPGVVKELSKLGWAVEDLGDVEIAPPTPNDPQVTPTSFKTP